MWLENKEKNSTLFIIKKVFYNEELKNLLNHFFDNQLDEIFSLPNEKTVFYHFNQRCSSCDYEKKCFEEANTNPKDLSLIYGMSKYKKQVISFSLNYI